LIAGAQEQAAGRQSYSPHGGYTILEAVDRLGPDWTAAALKAQRLLDAV
jgi:hypothetical protein